MSWTVQCYPWPQICSACCHYIHVFQHTLPVCVGREQHSHLTARWALAHQGVACLQDSPTGSLPHQHTCGQIVKGGHEHEVVGNGWVTNSCLIRRWLQIDHVLVLIVSGACARYWPHLTTNDHLPTKCHLIHISINSYKKLHITLLSWNWHKFQNCPRNQPAHYDTICTAPVERTIHQMDNSCCIQIVYTKHPHTTLWTSPAWCIRADLMHWKMSTTPSDFSLSSWEWMQMKVPVQPTPSLSKYQKWGGSKIWLYSYATWLLGFCRIVW